LLEPQAQPCGEELTRINESLQARERLLSASASASRLLLEAPDVRAAIPRVLGIIGEAAHVDRVNVMETRTGPQGEPLLVVVSEWTAPGVTPHLGDATTGSCDERKFAAVFAELRAGRSVCFSKDERSAVHTVSGIEGVGTRTKAIVPIFVAGEFMGVVGFDNTRQHRAIEASELAALETAAGVIGAALHRERLVDDVRREREHAAEERVAELAKANAVIQGNLERLAGATDLQAFMGHMLLEATRQFDAVSGVVIVLKDSLQEWRIVAHVRDGQLAQPTYATSVPVAGSVFTQRFGELREPIYLNVARQTSEIWPGVLAFHRSKNAQGTLIYPLVFGARSVGFLALTFQRNAEEVLRSGLLVALAAGDPGRAADALLAYCQGDRGTHGGTRIGQEIHDGLAQSFTGSRCLERRNSPAKKRGSNSRDAVAHPRLARRAAEARSVMALRLIRRRAVRDRAALLADRSTVPGDLHLEGGGIVTGCARTRTRAAAHRAGGRTRCSHGRRLRITMR
jgi:GAF domain-containing protein